MRNLRLLFILPVFILPACHSSSPIPQPSNPHLILESSFEGVNPFEGWKNNQHCCNYSISQSNARATDSSHSVRMMVKSTDKLVSGSIRSELVQPLDPVGTERWYGFNMFLENWDFDNACEHVFQWHPSNFTGVATAALWISSDRYIFETNSSGGNKGNIYRDLGPVIKNQWVAWVIHVRWADDETGILQVWKNGRLMIDKKNLATAPPGGTYFKLGINKFGWLDQQSGTTERVLYFDEVRIGNELANYDDVKPKH